MPYFGSSALFATMTESLAELQVQYQDFLQGEVRCESARLWLWWWRVLWWRRPRDVGLSEMKSWLDVSGIVERDVPSTRANNTMVCL